MSAHIAESLFAEFIRNMPLCTVDVMLFNPEVTKVLLFRRNNEPLKGKWFSLGGRLIKGETLKDCALRQARAETGLRLDCDRLFFGGVFDEIFDRSRFEPDVGLHSVNVCWGYLLPEDASVSLDAQHDSHQWNLVKDGSFHPTLRRKLDVLLPLARLPFVANFGYAAELNRRARKHS